MNVGMGMANCQPVTSRASTGTSAALRPSCYDAERRRHRFQRRQRLRILFTTPIYPYPSSSRSIGLHVLIHELHTAGRVGLTV